MPAFNNSNTIPKNPRKRICTQYLTRPYTNDTCNAKGKKYELHILDTLEYIQYHLL